MARLYEADGMCTALVQWPKGAKERFAFVMESEDAGVKMYFFVTKENCTEVVQSILEMIGFDA